MKWSAICVFLSCVGVISASWELDLFLNMVECEHKRDLNLDVSGIDVYFYDFPNNIIVPFPISSAAQGILSYTRLNKNHKFFMFVDGFKSHMTKLTTIQMRNAFKNFPNSYLIIIDHSIYTNRLGLKVSFEESVKYVYDIGKAVAQLLVDLHQGGISAKNVHCIGHSLGSQMLAHVGEIFHNATGEKISRITALDPAGPCFANSPDEDQIRSGVAEYVEVYHCNAGEFGTSSILGDIDFFVNNGVSQPKCTVSWLPPLLNTLLEPRCSHRACVAMWTASVAHGGQTAYKCDNYYDFRDGICAQNATTLGGFWNPGNATGVYYFASEDYEYS
ncbi:lipase member H [Helicoverpa armigera]|uniref:lipase member H n=1 Tax=Helicoverpa armigera TaxID=29058 RepID=UPI003083810C